MMTIAYNNAVTDWYVDFENGDNNNDGEDALRPLRDYNEIAIRTPRKNLATTTRIHQIGDGNPNEVAFLDWFPCGGVLQIIGTLPPPFFTGSCTAPPIVAATADLPSNDRYTIKDSSIPASYTASGLMELGVVLKFTHASAQAWGWPFSDRGSKSLQISIPTGITSDPGDLPADAGPEVRLIEGDTYGAHQLSKMYNVSWNPDLQVMVQHLLKMDSHASPVTWCKRTAWKLCAIDASWTVRGSSCMINCSALHGETGLSTTDAHPGDYATARHISGGAWGVVRMSNAIAMQTGLPGTAQAFVCRGILLNAGCGFFDVKAYLYDGGGCYLYIGSTLQAVALGGCGNVNILAYVEAGARFFHSGLARLPGPAFNAGCANDAYGMQIEGALYTWEQVIAASAIFESANDARSLLGAGG